MTVRSPARGWVARLTGTFHRPHHAGQITIYLSTMNDAQSNTPLEAPDKPEPSFGRMSSRPRRRALPPPSVMLGYGVAVVMTICGVAVLAGFLVQEGVPDRFRIMFGLVLALMGGYRFVLTRTRAIQRAKLEDEEE